MKKIALFLLAASLFAACTNEYDDVLQTTDNGTHTIQMVFDGTVEEFDGIKTRATTSFANGATMYISFSNNGSEILGTAVYNSSTQTWNLTYSGTLSSVSNATCSAYHFQDSASSTTERIYFNSSSTYYYGSLKYTKTSSSITISGTLSPNVSRVRFKGTNGKSIKVSGYKTLSSFVLSSYSVYVSSSDITLSVQSSGYTPYLYYTQCGDEISVTSDGTTYTMQTTETMRNRFGKTGYINIPTSSSHSGWTTEGGGSPTFGAKQTFTANGVSFVMIPVEAGTFTMGATSEQQNPYDNEKPTHQVTLTKNYYIGETEVTQALWKAVTGYSPTSGGSQWSSTYGLGNNYPAYYISYDDVLSFITKLNSLTGKTFRMPTEAEWEYAARGGKKSKGYQYSGSNTIGDVAWYTVNSYDKGISSPDYGTHQVKTKNPNELGIYDMSGNVWEWCSDWYGIYSSSSQTNPTGPSSGSYRVDRGGSWHFSARYCRSSVRGNYAPDVRYSSLGFRLALSE